MKGVSWEVVFGLVGAGLAAGCGIGIARIIQARRESWERDRLQVGNRIGSDSRFQVHTLHRPPTGAASLTFRPIAPAAKWEEVLKSTVLAKEVRNAAPLTRSDNPALRVPSIYQRALFTELRNSLSIHNRSVPGTQKEFLLMLTCEDSRNTIKDFQTAIRGFLITQNDLLYFADLDNVRTTQVESDYFGFRLIALHYLAKKFIARELREGEHFVTIQLPSRDDDKPLSTNKQVDWNSIYSQYSDNVEVSGALSELVIAGEPR